MTDSHTSRPASWSIPGLSESEVDSMKPEDEAAFEWLLQQADGDLTAASVVGSSMVPNADTLGFVDTMVPHILQQSWEELGAEFSQMLQSAQHVASSAPASSGRRSSVATLLQAANQRSESRFSHPGVPVTHSMLPTLHHRADLGSGLSSAGSSQDSRDHKAVRLLDNLHMLSPSAGPDHSAAIVGAQTWLNERPCANHCSAASAPSRVATPAAQSEGEGASQIRRLIDFRVDGYNSVASSVADTLPGTHVAGSSRVPGSYASWTGATATSALLRSNEFVRSMLQLTTQRSSSAMTHDAPSAHALQNVQTDSLGELARIQSLNGAAEDSALQAASAHDPVAFRQAVRQLAMMRSLQNVPSHSAGSSHALNVESGSGASTSAEALLCQLLPSPAEAQLLRSTLEQARHEMCSPTGETQSASSNTSQGHEAAFYQGPALSQGAASGDASLALLRSSGFAMSLLWIATQTPRSEMTYDVSTGSGISNPLADLLGGENQAQALLAHARGVYSVDETSATYRGPSVEDDSGEALLCQSQASSSNGHLMRLVTNFVRTGLPTGIAPFSVDAAPAREGAEQSQEESVHPHATIAMIHSSSVTDDACSASTVRNPRANISSELDHVRASATNAAELQSTDMMSSAASSVRELPSGGAPTRLVETSVAAASSVQGSAASGQISMVRPELHVTSHVEGISVGDSAEVLSQSQPLASNAHLVRFLANATRAGVSARGASHGVEPVDTQDQVGSSQLEIVNEHASAAQTPSSMRTGDVIGTANVPLIPTVRGRSGADLVEDVLALARNVQSMDLMSSASSVKEPPAAGTHVERPGQSVATVPPGQESGASKKPGMLTTGHPAANVLLDLAANESAEADQVQALLTLARRVQSSDVTSRASSSASSVRELPVREEFAGMAGRFGMQESASLRQTPSPRPMMWSSLQARTNAGGSSIGDAQSQTSSSLNLVRLLVNLVRAELSACGTSGGVESVSVRSPEEHCQDDTLDPEGRVEASPHPVGQVSPTPDSAVYPGRSPSALVRCLIRLAALSPASHYTNAAESEIANSRVHVGASPQPVIRSSPTPDLAADPGRSPSALVRSLIRLTASSHASHYTNAAESSMANPEARVRASPQPSAQESPTPDLAGRSPSALVRSLIRLTASSPASHYTNIAETEMLARSPNAHRHEDVNDGGSTSAVQVSRAADPAIRPSALVQSLLHLAGMPSASRGMNDAQSGILLADGSIAETSVDLNIAPSASSSSDLDVVISFLDMITRGQSVHSMTVPEESVPTMSVCPSQPDANEAAGSALDTNAKFLPPFDCAASLVYGSNASADEQDFIQNFLTVAAVDDIPPPGSAASGVSQHAHTQGGSSHEGQRREHVSTSTAPKKNQVQASIAQSSVPSNGGSDRNRLALIRSLLQAAPQQTLSAADGSPDVVLNGTTSELVASLLELMTRDHSTATVLSEADVAESVSHARPLALVRALRHIVANTSGSAHTLGAQSDQNENARNPVEHTADALLSGSITPSSEAQVVRSLISAIGTDQTLDVRSILAQSSACYHAAIASSSQANNSPGTSPAHGTAEYDQSNVSTSSGNSFALLRTYGVIKALLRLAVHDDAQSVVSLSGGSDLVGSFLQLVTSEERIGTSSASTPAPVVANSVVQAILNTQDPDDAATVVSSYLAEASHVSSTVMPIRDSARPATPRAIYERSSSLDVSVPYLKSKFAVLQAPLGAGLGPQPAALSVKGVASTPQVPSAAGSLEGSQGSCLHQPILAPPIADVGSPVRSGLSTPAVTNRPASASSADSSLVNAPRKRRCCGIC